MARRVCIRRMSFADFHRCRHGNRGCERFLMLQSDTRLWLVRGNGKESKWSGHGR